MINDLAELIKIKSVLSTPKPNAPFGSEMRKTLDWFLEKASSYGLKTGEYDGYCGYAEYGEGEELIGILCHLDVVPSGNGWSCPPFELTIKDGNLYGRGVVDNKGCAVIALHILKRLNEQKIKLNNRIRIIVGCNEENGSECLKHYVKHGEIPKMSFVPDADFPVINSEKGILTLKIALKADEFLAENILWINAGERENVVPDLAEAAVKIDSPLERLLAKFSSPSGENTALSSPSISKKLTAQGYKLSDFFVEFYDDKFVLKTIGVAGHAMAPHKADNALHKLFALLQALQFDLRGETVTLIHKLFCNSRSDKTLQIDFSDEKSGALTINLGVAKYSGENVELTFNLRLPLSAKKDEVIKNISSQLPKNATVTVEKYSHNLYVDPDSPLIKTLLGVYKKMTGGEIYTVQTGGGTYARELPNAVAFGPTFPSLVTNIHNLDEHISIELFNKLYEIYYETVLALDKV